MSLDNAAEYWRSLTNEQVLLYSIVVGVLVCRAHVFRYLKVFLTPLAITFIAVRAYNPVAPTVLSLLAETLRPLNSPHIGHAVFDLVGLVIAWKIVSALAHLLALDFTLAKKELLTWGFNQVRGLSFVKTALAKEQVKLEEEFEKDLKVKSRALGNVNNTLPKKGLKKEAILKLMRDATTSENVKWEQGHVSGAVYNGQHKHIELLNDAFAMYSISNPLHPDIWPSVMKFDSEVISMTANLVNGGDESVCGSSSSVSSTISCTVCQIKFLICRCVNLFISKGGTESIIMAIKTHRDYFREFHGITAPEMVVGNSAHAAVDKACDLMNIKLIKVALDPETYRIDLNALLKAIGPNTIMMYASAPSYPHGAIDPIKEMGAIAVKYNIGLHVDCCLGGFVLPFAKKMGYSVPGKLFVSKLRVFASLRVVHSCLNFCLTVTSTLPLLQTSTSPSRV
jgi:sphinganine-1-phosphate aldolase